MAIFLLLSISADLYLSIVLAIRCLSQGCFLARPICYFSPQYTSRVFSLTEGVVVTFDNSCLCLPALALCFVCYSMWPFKLSVLWSVSKCIWSWLPTFLVPHFSNQSGVGCFKSHSWILLHSCSHMLQPLKLRLVIYKIWFHRLILAWKIINFEMFVFRVPMLLGLLYSAWKALFSAFVSLAVPLLGLSTAMFRFITALSWCLRFAAVHVVLPNKRVGTYFSLRSFFWFQTRIWLLCFFLGCFGCSRRSRWALSSNSIVLRSPLKCLLVFWHPVVILTIRAHPDSYPLCNVRPQAFLPGRCCVENVRWVLMMS